MYRFRFIDIPERFTNGKEVIGNYDVFAFPRKGGRVVLPEKLGGGVRLAFQKTLTLFKTKVCDFPYPIYDLTKNSIRYL